jgi:hypothetical protein
MRKHANDSQALNRSSFPKSSAPIKRAKGLVAHFRLRANDPHLTDLVAGELPLPFGRTRSETRKLVAEPAQIPTIAVVALRRFLMAALTM